MSDIFKLYHAFVEEFRFEPTENQNTLFQEFSKFLTNPDSRQLFILKGYAGTGKTSVVSSIVRQIWRSKKKAVLLAPTGRAAKVLSNYAQKEAFTIHKKIYQPKQSNHNIQFILRKNLHKNTIFFADEASMISNQNMDKSVFNHDSLLSDLIQFVYSGTGCKLVLIGDTAQLPPVKSAESPALQEHSISIDYQKEVIHIELEEVMRQQMDSGILNNATVLRQYINDQSQGQFLFRLGNKDIIRLVDGYEIQEAIQESYDHRSIEDTAIIVWSNKRANQYNTQIRTQILSKEGDIMSGDYIMVVKNNYYWLDTSSEVGFIANGDTAEVLSVRNRVALYGFQFAEVTIRLIDYPNQEPFDVVVLLDTLHIDAPSLPYEQSQKLYQEVSLDYADLKSKYKIYQKVKENKYFNALQIKFSYAITCHKSQGGQWDAVFVEKPYLPEGQNLSYWRWLYTALTRAQEKVYLIGYSDADFEN